MIPKPTVMRKNEDPLASHVRELSPKDGEEEDFTKPHWTIPS
jgi:hypothetical protein